MTKMMVEMPTRSLAYLQPVSVGIGTVKKPAMHLEHEGEKSETFIAAGNFSGILVDEQ